jgi:hypothetical protein
LQATCSVKASPLPTITLGFDLDPCNVQGPTLNIFLTDGDIHFNHTFDGSADIRTPINVNIAGIASVAVNIHVAIGDLANNELPLTIQLTCTYKIPLGKTQHKTLATIFDGEFPIESPCALAARKPKIIQLH